MGGDQRSSVWPKIAGVIGILVAVALTAVIWFQVIDRQSTAMFQGDDPATGTPGALDRPADYWLRDDGPAPRPIP